MKSLVLVILLAGVARADDGNSFATGFVNGLSQALAARQGYQYQQPQQMYPDPRLQQQYYQQEQMDRLQQQIEILRQQLQEQQYRNTRDQWEGR